MLRDGGVTEWNAWRAANPRVIPDLFKADLSKADLASDNAVGVNLYSADLEAATLFGANLHGANLRDANFTHAKLGFTLFGNANLTGSVDRQGRVYISTGKSVHVFTPDGMFAGTIPGPQGLHGIFFGGRDKKTLFGIVFYDGWGTPSARNRIIAIPTIAQGFTGRAK
jgi:hypothetical protein